MVLVLLMDCRASYTYYVLTVALRNNYIVFHNYNNISIIIVHTCVYTESLMHVHNKQARVAIPNVTVTEFRINLECLMYCSRSN